MEVRRYRSETVYTATLSALKLFFQPEIASLELEIGLAIPGVFLQRKKQLKGLILVLALLEHRQLFAHSEAYGVEDR